jgi:hypothetical protein
MAQPADIGQVPVSSNHVWRPSALLIDNNMIFGGKSFGFNSPITTTVHIHIYKEHAQTSWTGFVIEVPYGPNTEDNGFGMCHTSE